MEKFRRFILLCLVIFTTMTGCTTVYKLNPLSRSHGLPAQFESEEE